MPQVSLFGFADVEKMERLEYSCELLKGFEMGGGQGHLKAKELKKAQEQEQSLRRAIWAPAEELATISLRMLLLLNPTALLWESHPVSTRPQTPQWCFRTPEVPDPSSWRLPCLVTLTSGAKISNQAVA